MIPETRKTPCPPGHFRGWIGYPPDVKCVESVASFLPVLRRRFDRHLGLGDPEWAHLHVEGPDRTH